MSDPVALDSVKELVEEATPCRPTRPSSYKETCKFAFEAVAVSVGLFTLIFLWLQMRQQATQIQQQADQSQAANALMREQIDNQAAQSAESSELIRAEIRQLATQASLSAEQIEQQRQINIDNRRAELLETIYGRRDCAEKAMSDCAFLSNTRVRAEATLAFAEIERERGDTPELTSLSLMNAMLSNAVLKDAILLGADLSGANLRNADLRDADLSRANLHDADLFGANLSNANLEGADLKRADLSGADLSRTNLRDADMSEANLVGANLWGADLWAANLFAADLWGANLFGAGLGDASLLGAELGNASFLGATYNDATWAGSFDLGAQGALNWDEMGWDERERWAANFHGAGLGGANPVDAELWDANLTIAMKDPLSISQEPFASVAEPMAGR